MKKLILFFMLAVIIVLPIVYAPKPAVSSTTGLIIAASRSDAFLINTTFNFSINIYNSTNYIVNNKVNCTYTLYNASNNLILYKNILMILKSHI